ncbi:MAG: NADH-quinone oxidoreductase subunit J [Phycisphaerae bacterium]|nr:NADH-quinone oxidoreductase subunit J [Phycisphaerae bacterium]
MDLVFYIASALAVVAALLAVTRAEAAHALVWLVASLLATAAVLFTLGAPFVAAMEVILYAGAVMVLFVFVVMMLDVARPRETNRRLANPRVWLGPATLCAALLILLVFVLSRATGEAGDVTPADVMEITPKRIGVTLFTHYLLAVELAGMLLLAALVGAVHLGRQLRREGRRV